MHEIRAFLLEWEREVRAGPRGSGPPYICGVLTLPVYVTKWSHIMEDGEHSVFRALGDPTRRQILDLLRQQPLTTGQLAAQFEMSRYGVMKHLGVLEDAGLVLVRRDGRQRFNHLNAVPIQQMVHRWVSRYAQSAADSLLNLKRFVETEEVMKQNNKQNIDSFQIEQELSLAAPRDKVWQALTQNVDDWWSFRAVTEGAGRLTLSAKPGGHFEEVSEDGSALWGVVTYIKKGEKLQLSGALGITSRPVNSLYTFDLEDANGGTLLKLSHECYGRELDELAEKYEHGWQLLLGKYLKTYVEEGKTCRQLNEA